jgi:predicted transposase/invertase (TIGR01784 family)
MIPKIDYSFKLIFGDENNKPLLIDLLCVILNLPKEEFEGIELINTELPRLFEDDKKGILDIRVKTTSGKQINIEIQLLGSKYMPERTLYYWGRMYTGQIKKSDKYKKLKKCITINILNYKCIPIDRIHTKYHLLEDDTNHKLTDVIEVHMIELPKLLKLNEIKDIDDPAMDWLKFINAESREVMEMLARKNENIKTAYEILDNASRDEKKRLAYEARQMAIMDEESRIDEAREEGLKEGLKEGIERGKMETVKAMLNEGIDIMLISKITKLPIEMIKELDKKDK